MARKPVEQHDEQPAYTSIMDRKSSDFKPPKLIPEGTWRLRGLMSSARQRSDDEGEYEIVSLIHEPFEATDSVDPELVNEIDEVTGKSAYDGRRVETAFFIRNANDVLKMLRVIGLHGVDVDDRDMPDIMSDFRGSFVYGRVGVKPATLTREAENKVVLWTSVEKFEADQD